MTMLDRLDSGGDIRNEMIGYIRAHFGDLLGEHIALLDQPNGLDAIADLIRKGEISPQAASKL